MEIILIKKVSTEDIRKMVNFVLKNNLFEFNSKFYKQISETAVGTKCSPPCAYIFIDHTIFKDARYKILVFEDIY